MKYNTEQQRLNDYKRYEKIYKGEVKDLWGGAEKEHLLKQNYAKLIVDFISRLLTAKEPRFIVQSEETQKELDKIIFNNKVKQKLSGVISQGQVLGGIVIRTTFSCGESQIEFIHPKYYEPELDPFDNTRAVKNTLVFESEREGIMYKKVEEDAWNTYTCKEYSKGKNDSDWNMTDEKKVTHNQGFLIQYVKFFGDIFDFWGDSVYLDTEDILKELNNRPSRIKRILDTFAEPKLIVPKWLFQELFPNEEDTRMDEYTNRRFGRIDGKDIFLRDAELDGDSKPEYMESFDAKITEALEFYNQMLNTLSILSDIPAHILNGENTPDAWRTLKVRMLQCLYRAEEVKKFINDPLKKALYDALCLQKQFGTRPVKEEWVEIDWLSGIPLDTEDVNIEIAKYEAKVQSRETTIKKINNFSSKQLQEELLRLAEDDKRELEGLGREFPIMEEEEV